MAVPDDWCNPNTPGSSSGAAHKLTGRSGDGNPVPITPSALCSMGWTTLLITGVLRDILTRHFSKPLNMDVVDLRHLVWQEGDRTGILIESIHRWRGDLVEKRPAIIIKCNSRQNVRLTIGDKAGIDERGQPRFQTYWVGSHTLFCIHGSGAAAEILATEVQREVHQYHPSIIDELGLYRWQVTEVGAIAEVEEARESFVVPITIGWAYDEKWLLEWETPKLRKISLDVLLDGAVIDDPQ